MSLLFFFQFSVAFVVAQSILIDAQVGSIDFPANSCQDVANQLCNATSDFYWIRSRLGNSTARYYCDREARGQVCFVFIVLSSSWFYDFLQNTFSFPHQFTIWQRGTPDAFNTFSDCPLDGLQVLTNNETSL